MLARLGDAKKKADPHPPSCKRRRTFGRGGDGFFARRDRELQALEDRLESARPNRRVGVEKEDGLDLHQGPATASGCGEGVKGGRGKSGEGRSCGAGVFGKGF